MVTFDEKLEIGDVTGVAQAI